MTDAWANALEQLLGFGMAYVLLIIATWSRADIAIRVPGTPLINHYFIFVVATLLLWLLVTLTLMLGYYLQERARSKQWRLYRCEQARSIPYQPLSKTRPAW